MYKGPSIWYYYYMEYKLYRLLIRKVFAVPSWGNVDTRYFDSEFTPTRITFKARTDKEAMRKACKFWREGDFGMGSITVRKEGI